MKILTFDIEDWFHVLDHSATRSSEQWGSFEERVRRNTARILTLLSQHGQKATFFCLGWVGETYPDVVRQIIQEGHEVATHSHFHQLAYEQEPKEYADDLKRSIDALEQVTGTKITTYRAPGFSVTARNLWVFDILSEAGITVDCSIFPARRAHGGIPKFQSAVPSLVRRGNHTLKEFPLNTASVLGRSFVYSGGGYFRLMPYILTRRFMRRADYVMTYFHPRDFDPDQPVVPGLSALRRAKSYYGLRSCEAKADQMLREFRFATVGEAARSIDWSKVPVVSLDRHPR